MQGGTYMRDYIFGEFLRAQRRKVGLTQFQLGALLGVSDKAVSKWENGTSRPNSKILYKLSEILGVSVDELLVSRAAESEDSEASAKVHRQSLLRAAFEEFRARYGSNSPFELMERFASEHSELKNNDIVLYFGLLSELLKEAKKHRAYIRVRGGVGASFIAYLLGATDINPLPPHYYCPECKQFEFAPADDCWDLPKKKCSCGCDMHCDGHNIPFETYRNVVNGYPSFDISIPTSFIKRAGEVFGEYFSQSRTVCLVSSEKPTVRSYVVVPDGKILPNVPELPFEEYYESLSRCVAFSFYGEAVLDAYKRLEDATGKRIDEVDFCTEEVLSAFGNCETDKIPEFKTPFAKNMLDVIKPKSFSALLKISGLAHGSGTWDKNAELLVKRGIPIESVIAYRDDIFNTIRASATARGIESAGLAYKIMDDTRRGVYARGGVSDEMKNWFDYIGVDAWFAESIEKIKYLFPKAHGVSYVKIALTLMWYKLNYPTQFKAVIG